MGRVEQAEHVRALTSGVGAPTIPPLARRPVISPGDGASRGDQRLVAAAGRLARRRVVGRVAPVHARRGAGLTVPAHDLEPAPPGADERHVPVLLDRVLALLAPGAGRARNRRRRRDARPRRPRRGDPRLVSRRPAWSGSTATPTRSLRAPAGSRRTRRRTTLVHAVYDELPDVLDRLGLARVDGVLLDLGVSSLQLDEVERGFSYSRDAPLDMRMDQTAGPTAADVVNTYPADRLARVIASYGEERFARRIAQRRRARAGDRADRDHEPARRPRARGRAGGDPVRHRAGTRPGARSRRCGSRSTVSSTRWPGRCRPRSRRSRSAVASSCSPTTRWRTAW